MQRGQIKNIAGKLLSISGVPPNLKKLIRHFGVRAMAYAMPRSVSGFVMQNPYKNEFVMVINNRMHYYHRRFTVAHELWHVLRGVNKITYRWELNNKNTAEERYANIFAAELLMPENAVMECYRNGMREISDYCDYFKVSAQAMEIRLQELKLSREEFGFSSQQATLR